MKIFVNHLKCLLLSNLIMFVSMAIAVSVGVFCLGVDIDDFERIKQFSIVASYVSIFATGILAYKLLKKPTEFDFLIYHFLLFVSFFLVDFLPVEKSSTIMFFAKSSLFLTFSSLAGYLTANILSSLNQRKKRKDSLK